MNDVQSTRMQRKQWQNLMNFYAAKNKKQLGKGEVIATDKIKEQAEVFTRMNKSSPVRAK